MTNIQNLVERGNKIIYELLFTKNESAEEYDGFLIGIFSTMTKINEIKNLYSNEVTGFKDCTNGIFRVHERNIQNPLVSGKVYRVVAWDWNNNGDEINIIYSVFYGDKQKAQYEFDKLKKIHIRQEWELNCHTIDECDWRDGFITI